MTIEKPYWRAVTEPKVLETNWYIPHDIAFNPNNQFYFGDVEDYAERFDLIAFLHSPEDKTQVIFRFWTIHEQFLEGGANWDLFAGRGVGQLSLRLKPTEDLIELVNQHTQDLIDIPEPEPIFQRISPTNYTVYDAHQAFSGFYKHGSLSKGILPDEVTFLKCSPKEHWGLSLKTVQAPRKIAAGHDVQQISDRSYGALILTKRGAEEFCEILRKRQ